MISKSLSTPKQPESLSEEKRQRILAENIRLHRDTARQYDVIHAHMRNSFEQHLQKTDIAFMLDAVRRKRQVVRVLEVGCGTGNLTMQFLAGGCKVTGVDISAEMIEVLKAKLDRERISLNQVTLFVADIDSFLSKSNTGGYDVVAMSSVAHHIPDYLTMLAAVGERIVPGGFLYLIHEPVHKQELATSYQWVRKLVSILPRGFSRLSYELQRANRDAMLNWSRQDTIYVDYHEHRDGVSVKKIVDRLSRLGFSIIRHNHYNGSNCNLASWVDNVLFGSMRYEQFQRTYFRVIFQRDSSSAV